MTDQYVKYAVAEGVATLTLDSPHNRNAISTTLTTQLFARLADAAADPEVQVVVLTHTGGTFCAGADLSEAGDDDPAARVRVMGHLLRSILELPKPVVGRIDGHVRAGGMGLVGACDLVVASPASTFALTEVRLGLAASIVSLTVLPRMSSRAANRYFLTGEKFSASVAERVGLVTVATDDVAAATDALVAELSAGSPQGLAESKSLVTAPILAEFDRHAETLAVRSGQLFSSPEAIKGMTAFLQRKEPRLPQQTRSRVTREKLLESTIDCLALHGWSATTVAVVAQHAGVSRGTIQHHFPTREDLITAALDYMFDARMAAITELSTAAVPTRDVVQHIVDHFTSPLFKAALQVWTAAANDDQLRRLVLPLETKFGRAAHRATTVALGADDSDPTTHRLIQATLDLARGLGLADVLSDDSARRANIITQWSATLAAVKPLSTQ